MEFEMNNFKQIVLEQIKQCDDEKVHKYFPNEGEFSHFILFKKLNSKTFEIDLSGTNLDLIKGVYSLFNSDLKIIREIIDLYMMRMRDTGLTIDVPHQLTFDIENFYSNSYDFEMNIPLKDRNVIAHKETFYTVRKYYSVFPTVKVLTKVIFKNNSFEPMIEIHLPLARKEKFLITVGLAYNIQTIDKIIQEAIRQRIICLIKPKRIKTFTKEDIKMAAFDDIARYMTLLSMDTI
jgi:hypothetical protein